MWRTLSRQLAFYKFLLSSQMPVGFYYNIICTWIRLLSVFVSYWSFQVINSLMRKYMSLELLVCSKNFLNESFTKHTVCIQFYLQHSLQLPWASYVSVSRRRHISMYVFLPSSLSDFVSSALRKMKKKIVIVYLWFPCSLLISKFCGNCVAKIVL